MRFSNGWVFLICLLVTVGCGEDKAPSGEADPAQGASAEESAGEGEGENNALFCGVLFLAIGAGIRENGALFAAPPFAAPPTRDLVVDGEDQVEVAVGGALHRQGIGWGTGGHDNF